ncbi:glycosyltransferase family 25 protein [Nemania diffusa]|nr:glycosyltransferase family 25 protein [Nemania diffusa]
MPVYARAARPRVLFFAAVFLVLFVYSRYWTLPDVPYKIRRISFGRKVAVSTSLRDDAANATLGFQKVLALSVRPSWRSRGLQAAASLTGLAIDIPPQPRNADAFVAAFQGIGTGQTGVRTPDRGSARAWVAHLDLLKHVVASGLASALVVEDDVDFDVRVRAQMRGLADHVRATAAAAAAAGPFGNAWDVLWLGHCGATIEPDAQPPPLRYADDTRCLTPAYAGWSAPFLAAYVPEGYRALHGAGQATVCTFAYGVTARGAQRVLAALGGGAGEAFDVHLATYCREGALRCLVVNPQLFHQYEPLVGGGSTTSVIRVANGGGREADEGGFEGVVGGTANLVLSARCRALFGSTCLRLPEGGVS